jgi:hypothetical protein
MLTAPRYCFLKLLKKKNSMSHLGTGTVPGIGMPFSQGSLLTISRKTIFMDRFI